MMPAPARAVWRRLRRTNEPQWDSIIHPDFARRVQLQDRISALAAHQRAPIRSGRQEHFGKLTAGFFPAVLEVMDRLAAAHGIRMLYPFCDVRLMEYCLALPPEQKLHRGWTRIVLRRAIQELPENVRWRTGKSDYTNFVVQRLMVCHRDLVEETIQQRGNVLSPYIDLSTVRACYQRYLRQPSANDAMAIWKVVTLSCWLRQVVGSSELLTYGRA
jgi:asparagine synthase (glutamine-hydrolysing)